MSETAVERRLREMAGHTRLNDDDRAAIDAGREAIRLVKRFVEWRADCLSRAELEPIYADMRALLARCEGE